MNPDDMRPIGEFLQSRDSSQCPFCNGPCTLPPMTDDRRMAALHEELRISWDKEKLKMPEYMLRRGVPAQFVTALKGALEESDAIRAVETWIRDSSSLLLTLLGPAQVGKSLACAYVLSTRTVIHRSQFGGLQTEYMKSVGMHAEPSLSFRKWDTGFQWVKAGTLGAIDKWDQEGRSRQRELENVRMLVIDEVGGGSWNSQDIVKRLDALIGRRVDQELRTMITSNLEPAEFRGLLGERVAERITRNGRAIECKDFRRGAA